MLTHLLYKTIVFDDLLTCSPDLYITRQVIGITVSKKLSEK